ncbi:hypothetical protein IW262DRAFT_1462673 [Armillaria fumosa]|nr:hypothetical protein IW262DRAFT_1462673 [Armillaria fumosa]
MANLRSKYNAPLSMTTLAAIIILDALFLSYPNVEMHSPTEDMYTPRETPPLIVLLFDILLWEFESIRTRGSSIWTVRPRRRVNTLVWAEGDVDCETARENVQQEFCRRDAGNASLPAWFLYRGSVRDDHIIPIKVPRLLFSLPYTLDLYILPERQAFPSWQLRDDVDGFYN